MALLFNPDSGAVRATVQVRPKHSQQEPHRPDIPSRKPGLSVSQDNDKEPLARAFELSKQGTTQSLQEAWELVDYHLAYVNPNSCAALTVGLDIYRRRNIPALAYQLARRVVEMDPSKSLGWSNLAMIASELYRFDEADACFRKAQGLLDGEGESAALLWNNWAMMLLARGHWADAEVMARRSLNASPESVKAKLNMGLSLLANGKWREGWPLYDAVIGFDNSRRKHQYRNEPVWDGSPGKHVAIYAEQGLGDEITFASMVPDAIKDCASVSFDCSDRLIGLFRRSFPGVNVRGSKPERLDASISVGGLGKFYRNEAADFPGTPYLVPDPDRVAMWKALFAKQGKPVIGIAWSGGVAWTGDRFRKIKLEQFLPMFRAVDAVWVSLQYVDASKEIAAFRAEHPEIDLRQYSYGTLTQDYDDTAALVAALHMTIGPPTSVIHLAGAMGAPCIAMKAPIDCWKFHSGLPFHKTNMELIPHRGNWDQTITDAAALVRYVKC